MRIMPISDSPWAPTGFGTNTRCISAVFAEEGHTVGYGGCQNPKHDPAYKIEWPLGSNENVEVELLPLLHPGQEKFGEQSFQTWLENFNPDLVFTHLDIQMFEYTVHAKRPGGINFPLFDEEGNKMSQAKILRLVKKALRENQKPRFKLGSIIPIDGQPSIPGWKKVLEHVDYPVAMSHYGQQVMLRDFGGYESTVISHGVDTDFFKPKMMNKPEPDCFIIGCVARNQHRKNIPRLMRAFKIFVEENKLTPQDTKLMLHMDWTDHMGWNIDYMKSDHVFGMEEYLVPATMGSIEGGEAPDDAGMVDIYNLMDIHALPTGGEGFGIPTLEAMSCGKPQVISNYTTSYELVGAKTPECPSDMLYPHGDDGDDNLIMTDRGFLVPYKDLMWDTPIRAAPRRALWDERAAAKAFEHYYHNRSDVVKHGKAAREYAKKHYDWNNAIGPQWVKWVDSIR
jgi:glycosyltransferase involved in cell wall biosynthesis